MKIRSDMYFSDREVQEYWSIHSARSGFVGIDKRFEHELNTSYLEVPIYEVLRE